MPITYTPIATYTFANSTTRLVTLSSIPATYTDLRIVVTGSYTVNDCQWVMQFNGDTGANYSFTILNGNGSTVGAGRSSGAGGLAFGWYPYPNAASSQGQNTIDVMNYSNSTTYKTALSRANVSATVTDTRVGLWRNTAAINSITFDVGTYLTPYWSAGSTINIYGIKAA